MQKTKFADEDSNQAFEDWLSDANTWGDLDQDYFNYVGDYIENESGSAEEMKTFQEFARQKYDEYLLEIHKEDELDDEEEPFPGTEDDD